MTYDYKAYLDLPTVRASKGGPVGPQVPAHLLVDFSEDAHRCEAIDLARQVLSEHARWAEGQERQETERRGRQDAVKAAKAGAGGGGGYPATGPRRAPVWEFSLSSGAWEAFKPEHQPELEKAYNRRDTETTIKIGTHAGRDTIVIVNFKNMTQHVRGSDRKRQVRRRE